MTLPYSQDTQAGRRGQVQARQADTAARDKDKRQLLPIPTPTDQLLEEFEKDRRFSELRIYS